MKFLRVFTVTEDLHKKLTSRCGKLVCEKCGEAIKPGETVKVRRDPRYHHLPCWISYFVG